MNRDGESVVGDVAHVVNLSGEPNMSLLSPSSSVTVPHNPVAAGVSDSGDSVVGPRVHAACVDVDASTVSRELTVECHTRGNRSASKSGGKTIVTPDLVHPGDPERKSVLVGGDAPISVSVGEGLVGMGGQMSGPLDSLQSFVVESSSGHSGSLGAVSGFLLSE